MFKVICVKDDWVKDPKENNRPSPAFGKLYTVTKTQYVKEGSQAESGLYYQLAEMNPISGFHCKGFAPLSSIDETEMERNYKTEKV